MVSLSVILPHSPEDLEKKKEARKKIKLKVAVIPDEPPHGLIRYIAKIVRKRKFGRFFFFFSHFYFPASGQAVVTGAVPSSPPVHAFNFYRA